MKDFRLLSLSSLPAWLEFLSRTITNAFSRAPLPSPPRRKGKNIFSVFHFFSRRTVTLFKDIFNSKVPLNMISHEKLTLWDWIEVFYRIHDRKLIRTNIYVSVWMRFFKQAFVKILIYKFICNFSMGIATVIRNFLIQKIHVIPITFLKLSSIIFFKPGKNKDQQ